MIYICSELVCKFKRTPSVRCPCEAVIVDGECVLKPGNRHICAPSRSVLFEQSLLQEIINNPTKTSRKIYQSVAPR